MSWEAIGAIAELLGAIGVIVSLVYLAKQIHTNSENVKQNTDALISDRDVSSNESVLALYRSLYENPELSELMVKGHANQETLTATERFRYNLALAANFESHQTFFVQHQKGAVSDELWSFYSSAVDWFCRVPGVVECWKHNG